MLQRFARRLVREDGSDTDLGFAVFGTVVAVTTVVVFAVLMVAMERLT